MSEHLRRTIELLEQLAIESPSPTKVNKSNKKPLKTSKILKPTSKTNKITATMTTPEKKRNSMFLQEQSRTNYLQQTADINTTNDASFSFETPMKSSRKSLLSSVKKQDSTKNLTKAESNQKKYIEKLFQLDCIKHKENLEELRQKFQAEELKEVTNKPKINEKSKSYVETQLPLYKRAEDLRKKNEKEKERLKLEFQKKDNEKNPIPSFKPDLTLTRKKLPVRDNKDFSEYTKQWVSKKNNIFEQNQLKRIVLEMKNYTFKPAIDKKSRRMAEKRKNKKNRSLSAPKTNFSPLKSKEKENRIVKMTNNSKRILSKSLNKKKKNSFMGPTLNHLNMINENKFDAALRRLSLNDSAVRVLRTTFMNSKQEFYHKRSKSCRGKSLCFMETLKKSESKTRELEIIGEKEEKNRKKIGKWGSKNAKRHKSEDKSFIKKINVVKFDKSMGFMLNLVRPDKKVKH